ncbi:MAG: putative bifunctional diguanylate cyclase/phosphodiesterase [Acidimicrobiia bacterium]
MQTHDTHEHGTIRIVRAGEAMPARHDTDAFVCHHRPDGTVVSANEEYYAYFGIDRNSDRLHTFLDLFDASTRATIEAAAYLLLRGETVIFELDWSKDGATRRVRWVSQSRLDPLGQLVEVHSVGYDITPSEPAAVRVPATMLESLGGYSTNATVILDLKGTIRASSPATWPLLEADESTLKGASLGSFVSSIDSDRWKRLFESSFSSADRPVKDDLVVKGAGRRRILEVVLVNLTSDPSIRGVVAHLRDVTAERVATASLAHSSRHDLLTGLANRTRFIERVQSHLRTTAGSPSRTVVIVLDIDRFKTINDSLGHTFGDAILRSVANRLTSIVHEPGLVARLSGDQFAVVAAADPYTSRPEELAATLLRSLRHPIAIDGRSVVVTASAGITSTSRSVDPTTLVRDAEVALYRAKAAGRNRWRVFDDADRQALVFEMETEQALRIAIEHDEFVLHYQPQFDARTGAPHGAEALIRWDRPGVGMVPPGRFIPVAEECGFIGEIGRWAVAHAMKQAAAFPLLGAGKVWVNLSAQELCDGDAVDLVREVLASSGMDPSRLGIELTESGVIHDPERAAEQMTALRSLGVAMALDDFGTGYSSLSHLQRFPFDVLKIDRAFTNGLSNGEANIAIVRGIITIAHAVGMDVCAEGVETPEQLAILRSLGCDVVSGWLFAPALDPTRFSDFIVGWSSTLYWG